jgi:hypothetical protein
MSENDGNHSDLELEVPLFTRSELPIGCRVLVKDGRKSGDRYEATILKHLENNQVKVKWFVAGYSSDISLGQIRGKVEVQLDQDSTRQSKRARVETKRFMIDTAPSGNKEKKQDLDSTHKLRSHKVNVRKSNRMNSPDKVGKIRQSQEIFVHCPHQTNPRGRVAKKTLQTQLPSNDYRSRDNVTTINSSPPSERRRKVSLKSSSVDMTHSLRKPFHFSESKVLKKSAPSIFDDSVIDDPSPRLSPCHSMSISNSDAPTVREALGPIAMKSTANRIGASNSRLTGRPGVIGQHPWKDGIRIIGIEEVDGALSFIRESPSQKDK